MNSVPDLFIENVLQLIDEHPATFKEFSPSWKAAADLKCETYLLFVVCNAGQIRIRYNRSVTSLERLLTSKRTICDMVVVYHDIHVEKDVVMTEERVSQMCALLRRSYKPVRYVDMAVKQSHRVSNEQKELIEKLAESIPGARGLSFEEGYNRTFAMPFLSDRLLDTLRTVVIPGKYTRKVAGLVFSRTVQWCTASGIILDTSHRQAFLHETNTALRTFFECTCVSENGRLC